MTQAYAEESPLLLDEEAARTYAVPGLFCIVVRRAHVPNNRRLSDSPLASRTVNRHS
jgi:hypothetical protein